MRRYSIIPWPRHYRALYDRTQNLGIWYGPITIHVRPQDTALLPVADYLADAVRRIMKLEASVETTTEKPTSMHAVEFRLLDIRRSKLGFEDYRFSFDSNGLRITAADPAGAFYGVQTFIQVMTLVRASCR
jgi:N-acetyl-beta-hexosaminidase